MKAIMNLFHTLFARQRSTDSIVRPLTKIVDELDKHATDQHSQSTSKTAQAAALMSTAAEHRAEATRAQEARAKIAGLLG